ncbi:Peptidoglycan D,D-transpeptidase MrdA [bioreactor metagenome]|uniref:Peptidoglycan D,D-transpeptidase MrdA n=1 Tax=bioreactor metagenome TaxID=1076179 RepID=A0A644T6N8_9ZZZZ|nr:penicillin-binding transpeptidase domain-containing protein [Candidatus Elulimicrobiales bacterium]
MIKNIFRKKFFKKRQSGGEINPEDIFMDSSNLPGLDTERMEGTFDRPISSFMEFLPLFVLIIVFSIFSYRLFTIQIQNYDFYKEKSDNNRYNAKLIIANRGEIYDRNGEILAKNTNVPYSDILKREYIETPGFSNFLGYVSSPKKDNLDNFWQDTYIGKDGIELFYDELLTGVNGKRIVEKDVRSSVESENLIVKPVPGADLTLTIDSALQEKLYSSIRNWVNSKGFISGAGIIMDVNNGEVFALASYPEYNNNLMTNASTTEEKKEVAESLLDKRTPFLNRVTSGLFTPGSVVKPFMAYGALNEGVISPDKKLLSKGAIVIENKYGGPDTVFRDWKVHGWVNVVEAIAVSSDEYFYQVGGGYQEQKGLGITKIDEYAKLFGLSTPTGIDLPGEISGVIPTPDWKRINFIDGEWRLGDTYHTSIGQFGFQLTPAELVRYTASIANNGKLVTPHLFLSATSSNELSNKELINQFNNKVWNIQNLNLNQNSLKYVKQGMKNVVLPGGTVSQLNIPGLDVAAKSGTAEIGVVKGRVNSLMVGYFPYENPKYAFAVILENGPVDAPGASWAIKPVLEYIAENGEQYLD